MLPQLMSKISGKLSTPSITLFFILFAHISFYLAAISLQLTQPPLNFTNPDLHLLSLFIKCARIWAFIWFGCGRDRRGGQRWTLN